MEYTRRALDIDEKAHGPNHPTVATLANNIGTILRAQGDLRARLKYTRRALHILQATLGPENPRTKIAAGNLAGIEKAIKTKQANA